MPPVSEAQRRLAHTAAAHKGGVGGMSQAVGKEFSAADEPGKLPERKNRRSERMYGKKTMQRGFAEGGEVTGEALKAAQLARLAEENAAAKKAGKKYLPVVKGDERSSYDTESNSLNARNEFGNARPLSDTAREVSQRVVADVPNAEATRMMLQEDAASRAEADRDAQQKAETGKAKGGLVNALVGRGGKGVKLSHATGGPVDETTSAIMRSEGERESMKPRAPFYRSGGKIAHVVGRPVGKDDGMIAAQRGEFVVRKSAVKKLGTAALDEINKGRLPSQRLYGGKRMVRHG